MNRIVCGWALVAVSIAVATTSQVALGAERPTCESLAAQFEARRTELAAPQVSAALFAAADNGCEALALRLLGSGASVAARDRTGGTALTHAARNGQVALVRLLVAHGSEVNQRTVQGATPLFIAVEKDQTASVAALVALGADVNLPGGAGVSPVSAAAFNGNLSVVTLLLDHHADPAVVDLSGKSPIAYAAARGHEKIVARLLAAGIDVRARYGHDLTVLMWAAGSSPDVLPSDGAKLAVLLQEGAEVNAQDDRGRTALMMAAGLGHGETVSALLLGGADPALRDYAGKGAADLASSDIIKTELNSRPSPAKARLQ